MNTSQEPAPKKPLRWRTIRRVLLSLACLATLVAVFYAVENWRGQRAWEECRRELEAKGVELNWDKLVSPPVPDDQNFYSAPEMAGWFVKPASTIQLTNGFHGRLNHPATASVMGTNVITNAVAAAEYIEWSRQFQPEFDLIREALKRPHARINGIYDQPYEIPIPGFVTMRRVAQTLAQRTHCHLLLGQPGEAVDDLTLLHQLRRVLEGRPTGKPMTLVAAMINVAIAGLYSDAISEGLQKRAWRESDLATIESQLDEVRLLPVLEEAYRCELAANCRAMIATPQIFINPQDLRSLKSRLQNSKFLYIKLAPRGWFHQNLAVHARAMLRLIEAFDSRAGFVQPREVAAVHPATGNSHSLPYTFLIRNMEPNHLRATQTAALKQTLVNETLLACAIEHYHLANGVYPETLDSLVPKYIAALPRDVINGQPLKYHRLGDGGFVLYSVGWNETDDNGREDAKGNFEDGDWIWRQRVTR